MKKKSLTKNAQKAIGFGSLLVVIFLAAFLFFYVGKPLVAFVSEPESFRLWVDSHGIWGRLAFLGMVFLQVLIAIIPGEPFEIVAGYAFGIWEGLGLCLLGIFFGSMLVFFLVRTFGTHLVQIFFSQEKLDKLHFLKDNAKRRYLFFILYMLPGTPKDLLSYFIGLTDIPAKNWILICTIGRIPSVITSVVGGSALGTQDYLFAILVFAITALLSGGGLLLYNYLSKKHSQKKG